MILKNGKRIDGCSDTLPVGTVQPFLGLTPPLGYLICQGQLVSKVEYPELYNICKSTFGVETETHFYLPDLRGRTIAGYDSSDTAMNTIGKLLGAKTHLHNIPDHYHWLPYIDIEGGGLAIMNTSLFNKTKNYQIAQPENTNWGFAMDGGLSALGTAGGQHGTSTVTNQQTNEISNFQPTMVMNWIVKAVMLIPEYFKVENTLTSTSTSNALSAAQGKILSNSINDIQKQMSHDFMILGFSGAESTWTEDGVWIPVGFGTVKSYSGAKLINSMPNVKIGAGVSKVRVFVQLTYYQESPEDYMFLAITKNGTNQAKSIQAMANWGQITVDYVLSVKEGDLIGAQVYKDNNGVRVDLQDFTGFTNAPCNYLLVEVIE